MEKLFAQEQRGMSFCLRQKGKEMEMVLIWISNDVFIFKTYVNRSSVQNTDEWNTAIQRCSNHKTLVYLLHASSAPHCIVSLPFYFISPKPHVSWFDLLGLIFAMISDGWKMIIFLFSTLSPAFWLHFFLFN